MSTSEDRWFEVWYSQGEDVLPTWLLIVTPDAANPGLVVVCDPLEGNRIVHHGDNFGARYFASTQGRFTSPDAFWKDSQVGDAQSWNKYAYVRNNPLKYVDPQGEKADVDIETDENLCRRELRPLSQAVVTPHGSMHKIDHGIVSAAYKTGESYESIKLYYHHELTSRGWNFSKEGGVVYDGTDYGGKEWLYCKRGTLPVYSMLDDKRRSLDGLSRLG